MPQHQLTSNLGMSYSISKQGLTIGRSHSNAVYINDPRVSRLHARILYANGSYWIRDENSQAGTFVNGKRVNGQQAFNPGDTLQIGSITFWLTPVVQKSQARTSRKLEQRSQLAYVAIFGTVLVILVFAIALAGGGTYTPFPIATDVPPVSNSPTAIALITNTVTNPPTATDTAVTVTANAGSGSKIIWGASQMEFTIRAGTSDSATVEFTPADNLSSLSLQISPELQSVLKTNGASIPDLQANQKYALPLIAESSIIDQSGVIQGEIYFSSPNATIEGRLPVRVTINGISSDVIPTTAGVPSTVRITEDADGQKLVKDELIIGLKNGTANPDERAKEIAKATGGAFLGSIPDTMTYQLVYKVADLNQLESIRQQTAAMPDVEFASHDFVSNIASVAANSGNSQMVNAKTEARQNQSPTYHSHLQASPCYPNDSAYDSWDENNPAGNNWHLEMIKAPSAWCITTGSKDVNIAIIDVDIDRDHIDLKDNLAPVDGIRWPQQDKISQGHGTHVAGLICAKGNNATGVTGVMWDCTLKGYHIQGDILQNILYSGIYGDIEAPIYSLMETMKKAVDNDAQIVNMSLQVIDNNKCGTPYDSESILKKVDEANKIFSKAIIYAKDEKKKDVLWIFAAGNECRDTKYASPASLTKKFPDNTLAVASVDGDGGGTLNASSNQGDLVTVAAPGGGTGGYRGVFSTMPRKCDYWLLGCNNGEYGMKEGTSMAAPLVTGLAGLILSVHPNYTSAQIKECIVNGAQQKVKSSNGSDLSFGIINAYESVKCSHDSEPPLRGPTETPTITPSPTVPVDPFANWLTYNNAECGFSIKYPPGGILSSYQGKVRLDLPFAPGTNLHEKYALINCSTDSASRQPLGAQTGQRVNLQLNGIDFQMQSGAEGAAGNFYQDVNYSTQRGSQYSSIDFMLHSVDRFNYIPPITEFDKPAEEIVFSQIMSTFRFSSVSPTPTSTFKMPKVKFRTLKNSDRIIADIHSQIEEIPNAVKYQWLFYQNGKLLYQMEGDTPDRAVDYAAGMALPIPGIKLGALDIKARAQINVAGELKWTDFSTVKVIIQWTELLPIVKFSNIKDGDRLYTDISCNVGKIPNAVKYQWSFYQNGALLYVLTKTASGCFVDYVAGGTYYIAPGKPIDIKPGDLSVNARVQINVSGDLIWSDVSTVTVKIGP